MIKGTHFCHLRNPESWKNSIDALLLNSLSPKEHSTRDLGSPGNRQLLQLQLFSPNFLKFLGPSSWFSIIIDRWTLEPFGHAVFSSNFEDRLSACLKFPCLFFMLGRGREFSLLAKDKLSILFFKATVSEVERFLTFADS